MPKVKIVLYKDKIKLYLDGNEIPLRRLPDLVPLHIDTVNPDAHGAVVLEGEAWYGLEDEFLPAINTEEEETPPTPVEVRSETGNLILRDYGKRIEVEIRYGGNLYRLRYDKSPSISSALTPQLISLRVMGRLDNNFIEFLFKEFRSRPIKDYIRRLSREIIQ